MQNIKAYIFLVLCTLFWAGNFIVGKVATLFDVPPFTLNFYRWLIAFLILFPFTYKKIFQNIDEVKNNLIPLSIMGFASITIFNSSCLLFIKLYSSTQRCFDDFNNPSVNYFFFIMFYK